jgi:hypothetical protein
MAKAEVAWEDYPGTWRGAQAKIEDTSRSGACVRVGVPISVGSRLKIKWHREEFFGVAKYCRRDGGDYVLGIQRETSEPGARATVSLHQETASLSIPAPPAVQEAPEPQEKQQPRMARSNPEPAPATIPAQNIAPTVAVDPAATIPAAVPLRRETIVPGPPKPLPEKVPAPVAVVPVAPEAAAQPVAKLPELPPPVETSVLDLPAPSRARVPAPVVAPVVAAPVAPTVAVQASNKLAGGMEAISKSIPFGIPSPERSQESDALRLDEVHAQEPTKGQERTTVLNKFLHIGSGRQQQNAADGSSGNTKAQVNNNDAKPMRESQTNAKARPTGMPPNQGSLLSLQDIYLAVGIMSSRLGYNIDTLSAMLDSGHLQGMTGEAKRASVLMALEAAGIPVEELIRDGSKRLDALNAYEEAEHKRYEEYEARKAQESAQIQLEIERMTAHCLERIKHNLGEVTQAKDAFLNWQTIKQKESQRITDAVALFTKPQPAEKPSELKPMLQTVGAESK